MSTAKDLVNAIKKDDLSKVKKIIKESANPTELVNTKTEDMED